SSKKLPVYFGVPQGIILGPILFHLYIADLPNCIKAKSIQYADDTTLYESSKEANIPSLIKDLEHDLASLSSWSNGKMLMFDGDKLQLVSFSKNRGLFSYLMRSDNKSIPYGKSAKLLGVTFDESLNWSEQINNILKSCYGTLRKLKNFQRSSPFKVRKSLAEALILSKLNYCNVVYGAPTVYAQTSPTRTNMCSWLCFQKICYGK
ncbi:MAG: reverse transcriptase domain-containing protein, partial [Cyanobacteria bacterium J06649_11]